MRSGREAGTLKIRRALLTVSDKEGLPELGRALVAAGAEIVATGRTALVLEAAGIQVTPIEKVSGSPEAFQGRMKTLSFPVCSGILYRRGDDQDAADLAKLSIQPIDCVVVNFYPFEKAAKNLQAKGEDVSRGAARAALIEEIDIGGPTLVRAAAKNSPDVLVLTDPAQYARVIGELAGAGGVSSATAEACAARAWERIAEYDNAIVAKFGEATSGRRPLRYGENPHQQAELELDPAGPIAWDAGLTTQELSYNNILDLSAAYALASDLIAIGGGKASGRPEGGYSGAVIVKHNNPCGIALVPSSVPGAQLVALQRAWEGDPVSAFGGVLAFTDALEPATATWLSERFVELVAAPGLAKGDAALATLTTKRKNLKALPVRRYGEVPARTTVVVPGGRLHQTSDVNLGEELRPVTKARLADSASSDSGARLARFGIAACRALKSNAIALVRELKDGTLQLVGAGQGQPNRVEALQKLAVPRARAVLAASGGSIADCIMVSDAFFPFRDTVDAAHAAGIRAIIQPGGSIKDAESIAACDEHGIAMAFTGVRHFRH